MNCGEDPSQIDGWLRRERAIAWLCLVLGVAWLPLVHLLLVLLNGEASTTLERVRLPGLLRLEQQARLIWPVVLVVVVAVLLRRGRGPVLVVLPHIVALANYRVALRYVAAPFSFVVVLVCFVAGEHACSTVEKYVGDLNDSTPHKADTIFP